MRSVRHLLTAAALLAAAACANSDGITSPRSTAPPRLDGGYMGSGGLVDPGEDAGGITSSAPAGGVPLPGDSTEAGGGGERGGYMGSGG
jgi:hypothetical protein